MTPEEAGSLAARIYTAIDECEPNTHAAWLPFYAADRERIAADLTGLRYCWEGGGRDSFGLPTSPHYRRYADGLRRTAALYGVTP